MDRFIIDRRVLGDTVETLRRTSKFARELPMSRAKAFVSGLYSTEGVRMMKEALQVFKPEVVNVHNLYPFISPAALFQCRRQGIPVVMTVHNYRLLCPTGLLLRDNKPCHECLTKGHEWPCVHHNCEASRSRTTAYALRSMMARITGAYTKCVDTFCCLTDFQRRLMLQAGIEEKRLVVIPNYIPDHTAAEPTTSTQPYVAYAGRLSKEKGYDLLMEAAQRLPHINFRFAGESGMQQPTTQLPNVHMLGMMSEEAMRHFYAEAAFVVLPSRCYEGLPNVLLEAYQGGKAVIAPNHGAFPDLIQQDGQPCGRLFEAGNAQSLTQEIDYLFGHPDECLGMGCSARKNYENHFTPQIVQNLWTALLKATTKRL